MLWYDIVEENRSLGDLMYNKLTREERTKMRQYIDRDAMVPFWNKMKRQYVKKGKKNERDAKSGYGRSRKRWSFP